MSKTLNIDTATQKVTAFASFNELLVACQGGYIPTLEVSRMDTRSEALAKQVIRKALLGHNQQVYPAVAVGWMQ